MSDSRRTRFNTQAQAVGLTDATGAVVSTLNHGQLDELVRTADAAGAKMTLTPDSHDTFVLAPAASQANTLTIKAVPVGKGTGVVTVQVNDNGSDALAVTVTSGAILIRLANTTDANNTLTLIKAALDAALTSTTGAIYSTFITGTGSTQMVHGGTNTLAATAAGGTAGTSLKSSTAGASAVTIVPA